MKQFEFQNVLNMQNDGAWCNLLQILDVQIMFDCGCSESATQSSDFQKIVSEMKQVGFIFLSDADFTVLGCLPYLYKNGLLQSTQIFATSPVAKLGAQALFEFLIEKKESGQFSAYSLDDIEAVINTIQLVSYDERKRIKIQQTELIVSALPSGKSLGSAIWKVEINKFNIFYALNLNDQSQQITQALSIDKFVNANLLISNGYLNYNKEGRQYNEVIESRLRQKIEKVVIEQQGQILIPCSNKGKILEILLTLEQIFASKPRDLTVSNADGVDGDARVIYLEHMSRETLDVAKSHTSWMSLNDNAQFQDLQRGASPFNFQFVKLISTLDEYHQYAYTQSRVRPLVVVTSLGSLQHGFSQQILREFSARDSNEIIMIEKPTSKLDSIVQKIFQNQKRFLITETSFQAQSEKQILQITTPVVARKPSIDEIISDTMLRKEASTIAENQLLQQNQLLHKKRMLKSLEKSFQLGKFALFRLPLKKQLLCLYGEEPPELFTTKQVAEVQQISVEDKQQINEAATQVQQEQHFIQTFNRFKDLQQTYNLPFNYTSKKVEVNIKCQVSYLPLETRIDRVGFEYLLIKTMPQHLVLINSSHAKATHMRDFITSNNLNIHIDITCNSNLHIEADTSIKSVFVDSNLQKQLSLHRVLNFEVCRVQAKLIISSEQVFDELQIIDQQQQCSSKQDYMFVLPKKYKLQELQHYLAVQLNLQTQLIDGCLSYRDKLFMQIDQQNQQINLKGAVCPEYFQVRKLIYSHFGRM